MTHRAIPPIIASHGTRTSAAGRVTLALIIVLALSACSKLPFTGLVRSGSDAVVPSDADLHPTGPIDIADHPDGGAPIHPIPLRIMLSTEIGPIVVHHPLLPAELGNSGEFELRSSCDCTDQTPRLRTALKIESTAELQVGVFVCQVGAIGCLPSATARAILAAQLSTIAIPYDAFAVAEWLNVLRPTGAMVGDAVVLDMPETFAGALGLYQLGRYLQASSLAEGDGFTLKLQWQNGAYPDFSCGPTPCKIGELCTVGISVSSSEDHVYDCVPRDAACVPGTCNCHNPACSKCLTTYASHDFAFCR